MLLFPKTQRTSLVQGNATVKSHTTTESSKDGKILYPAKKLAQVNRVPVLNLYINRDKRGFRELVGFTDLLR